MELGGSESHSQKFSNNFYPGSNQANFSHFQILQIRSILIYCQLRLGLPRDDFPIFLLVKMFTTSLSSHILIASFAHLYILNLIF